MQRHSVDESNDMSGRICLITGATSGIGLATAHELAARGATIALVGRNEAKTRAVMEDIRQRTGNTRIDYLLADLSSQAAVRRLADACVRRYGALHVLINNAGAFVWGRRETADGLEMTLAVNYLAPFLLTNLLLETLRGSAPSRVITVASAMHRGALIPFDDVLQTRGRYSGVRVYSQTKLATIMFTYELARRLSGSCVTANALHPGFVATNIYRTNNTLLNAVTMTVVSRFALSPEEGAQTSIYLASSPDVASVSGQYFIKCKPVRSSPASYDEVAQQRLWQISAQLTGLAGMR